MGSREKETHPWRLWPMGLLLDKRKKTSQTNNGLPLPDLPRTAGRAWVIGWLAGDEIGIFGRATSYLTHSLSTALFVIEISFYFSSPWIFCSGPCSVYVRVDAISTPATGPQAAELGSLHEYMLYWVDHELVTRALSSCPVYGTWANGKILLVPYLKIHAMGLKLSVHCTTSY